MQLFYSYHGRIAAHIYIVEFLDLGKGGQLFLDFLKIFVGRGMDKLRIGIFLFQLLDNAIVLTDGPPPWLPTPHKNSPSSILPKFSKKGSNL